MTTDDFEFTFSESATIPTKGATFASHPNWSIGIDYPDYASDDDKNKHPKVCVWVEGAYYDQCSTHIPIEVMDELCSKWLAYRGTSS